MLKIVSSLNSVSKTMVFLYNEPEEKAQEILLKAFHRYKMLKSAVALINDVNENGKYIQTTVSVLMYNPFSDNSDGENLQMAKFQFSGANYFETFKDMKLFMENRLKNLQKFPFRINIFEYPMISKAERDGNGAITHFSYVDGDTLTSIAKCMNFTLVYERTTEDNFFYGFQHPNGTFVGSLADVEYNRVELVANPRLISDTYNTTNSVFLQPLTTVRLSFIIQKRKTHKKLMISIFGQYDKSSRLIAMLLTFLFPIMYAVIRRYEDKTIAPQSRVESFTKSILYSLAIQNNVSMNHSPHASTRIIVTVILFHTLIISTLFQSTIVKNLNTNQRLGKINTVQELIDQGYTIKMPGYLAMNFKTLGTDKVSKMMIATKQNYVDVATSHQNIKKIIKPDAKTAFLWTDLYNTNYLNRFFDQSNGENLFESIPEIAFEFYISLMAPRSSPFIEKYNIILQYYVESGIGAHHVGLAYYDNDKVWIQRIKAGQIPKPSDGAIKFEDLRLVFEIQLYLSVFCCIVFVAEILLNRIKSL